MAPSTRCGQARTAIKPAYAIAAREAGNLYDRRRRRWSSWSHRQALAGIATTPALPPRLPSADNPTGDRLAPGQYVIHREASVLTTPYLPDPAAGGVALRAMPGHGRLASVGPMDLGDGVEVVQTPQQELVLIVPNGHDWPDSQGFRIVLDEQPAAISSPPCKEDLVTSPPKWDKEARELRLFVPKGHIVRLRYASFVRQGLARHLRHPDWVADAGARNTLLADRHLGVRLDDHAAPHADAGACHAATGVRTRAASSCRRSDRPGRPARDAPCQPQAARSEHRQVRDRGQLGRMGRRSREAGAAARAVARCPRRDAAAREPRQQLHPRRRRGRAAATDPARPTRTAATATSSATPSSAGCEYRARATTRFREYLPPALYAQVDKVTRLGPAALETGHAGRCRRRHRRAGAVDRRRGRRNGTLVPASAAARRSARGLRAAHVPLAAQRRPAQQPRRHPPRQRPARLARSPLVQLGRRRAARCGAAAGRPASSPACPTACSR